MEIKENQWRVLSQKPLGELFCVEGWADTSIIKALALISKNPLLKSHG